MNVLVIGGGGREHALVWRLVKSPSVRKVFAAPGNPGVAGLAKCFPAATVEDYLAVAEAVDADLTVVGPEVPLVAGIVDRFRAAGRAITGPTQAAAEIEGSKAFSKAFMLRAGIPTARHITVENETEARQALRQFDYPIVLKADGLAAGKGVVISRSKQEAEDALTNLIGQGRVVIEEFLKGEEVSYIVLSDGKNTIPLEPCQDHKAVFDGDKGPNTGGMGAYCDSRILSTSETETIENLVIRPAIEHMSAEGRPFTGFLYAGLMMTSAGPKALEFNARLGDPETQPLTLRLKSDLGELLMAAAQGDVRSVNVEWEPGPSVCVVLAAEGYPVSPQLGDAITGIEEAEQSAASVFQAGTRLTEAGLVTAGGRVLGVTTQGPELSTAIRRAYQALGQISFRGMHFRKDIGAKGLRRYNTDGTGT